MKDINVDLEKHITSLFKHIILCERSDSYPSSSLKKDVEELIRIISKIIMSSKK